MIRSERHSHPSNLIPLYLENYISFLTVFIGDEPAAFEKFKKSTEDREDSLRRGVTSSPWLRYCLATMQIQLSLCQFKAGEFRAAAFCINRASHELSENEKQFPDFLPQKSAHGLINVLSGLVPENYNWIMKLLGTEGNVRSGIEELSVMCSYSGTNDVYRLLRVESLLYLAYLDAFLGKDASNALSTIQSFIRQNPGFPEPGNPLMIFIRASVLARAGNTDEAIDVLCQYHPATGEYPFYYLDYLTGLYMLYRLDSDADIWFIRFLKNYRGTNGVKSGYQKLAWTYLLAGNLQKYNEYMEKALTRGAGISDIDRQAQGEASSGEVPDVILLKARLLSDGSYYDRAMAVLTAPGVKDKMLSRKEKLEYNYRLGRISQQSGRFDLALTYYAQTIEAGSDQIWYFACNAALQSGIISEQRKDYRSAEKFYRLCLSMKNTEYKPSLDQKARLGLKRISGKVH